MSGGITQLVAIGAQDVHLVGNPEVSFFRSTYKRHTNFSQTIENQVIQGTIAANGTSTVRFERKGDLLGYVYLLVTDGTQALNVPSDITGVPKWTALISKVQLLIGGQVIDEQTSDFSFNIANELLSQNYSKTATDPVTGFYPLRFFFCENWQSALPLVALQYHDVEIRITWGASATATVINGMTTGNPQIQWQCLANFTYLDTDERSSLANSEQNMLIYQVQRSIGSLTKVQDLAFNHPIKFLASSNLTAYGTLGTPTAKGGLFATNNKIKLQINGTDVSGYKYASPNYTSVPLFYNTSFADPLQDNLFLFPFCIDTSKLQPTGTLNFSRLDSARLVSDTDNIVDDVYAVNYNILRIQNGMGGLMYAN